MSKNINKPDVEISKGLMETLNNLEYDFYEMQRKHRADLYEIMVDDKKIKPDVMEFMGESQDTPEDELQDEPEYNGLYYVDAVKYCNKTKKGLIDLYGSEKDIPFNKKEQMNDIKNSLCDLTNISDKRAFHKFVYDNSEYFKDNLNLSDEQAGALNITLIEMDKAALKEEKELLKEIPRKMYALSGAKKSEQDEDIMNQDVYDSIVESYGDSNKNQLLRQVEMGEPLKETQIVKDEKPVEMPNPSSVNSRSFIGNVLAAFSWFGSAIWSGLKKLNPFKSNITMDQLREDGMTEQEKKLDNEKKEKQKQKEGKGGYATIDTNEKEEALDAKPIDIVKKKR